MRAVLHPLSRAKKITALVCLAACSIIFPAHAIESPTELTVIQTENGNKLQWRKVPEADKYNVYVNGPDGYLLTLQQKHIKDGDAPYVFWTHKEGTEKMAYSLVSVTGKGSKVKFSVHSEFVYPRVIPDPPTDTPVMMGGTANTVNALMAIAEIGLFTKEGDTICIQSVKAQLIRDGVVKAEMPSTDFCVPINLKY